MLAIAIAYNKLRFVNDYQYLVEKLTDTLTYCVLNRFVDFVFCVMCVV